MPRMSKLLRVLYDFKAEEPGELSVKAADILVLQGERAHRAGPSAEERARAFRVAPGTRLC